MVSQGNFMVCTPGIGAPLLDHLPLLKDTTVSASSPILYSAPLPRVRMNHHHHHQHHHHHPSLKFTWDTEYITLQLGPTSSSFSSTRHGVFIQPSLSQQVISIKFWLFLSAEPWRRDRHAMWMKTHHAHNPSHQCHFVCLPGLICKVSMGWRSSPTGTVLTDCLSAKKREMCILAFPLSFPRVMAPKPWLSITLTLEQF